MWDKHLGGNLIGLFQISHLQALSVRFGGENMVLGFISYQNEAEKKSFFSFLPAGFGSKIGMFEEEDDVSLKNVTGAANLVAENIFLWVSETWIH